jgi:hypothetical protein
VTREQLAHILRAAAQVAEVSDVVVIGSQSVLGTFDDAVLSDEVIDVDVAFLNDLANESRTRLKGRSESFRHSTRCSSTTPRA